MRRLAKTGLGLAIALWLGIIEAGNPAMAADFALLIGASKYEKVAGLKDLKYSRDDVIEFAEVLKRSGYKSENVILMHDGMNDSSLQPTYASIVRRLDLLLERLEEQDTVLIALAGHGVQFQGQKDNYFCPIDTKLDRHETMIALREIYSKLDECRAAHKLLLVDACRNDPQSNRARDLAGVKLESVTRPQTEAIPKTIAAIFSCDKGQQSFEDDTRKHGIFFANVLKGWEGAADGDLDQGVPSDGKITLGELFEYVRQRTSDHAYKLGKGQRPVIRNEGETDWILRKLNGGTGARPLDRARGLVQAKRFADARAAYSEAIALNPNQAKAFHGRGQAALALGDVSAAVTDFREAVRLDPKDVQAWISLGGGLGRSGQPEEALRAYNEAIRLDRQAANAYVGRGASRLELGQLDTALIDLTQALRLKPNHPAALFYRAQVYSKRGDPVAAQADRERLQALEGHRP